MMKTTIRSHHVVCFDVDDTLINYEYDVDKSEYLIEVSVSDHDSNKHLYTQLVEPIKANIDALIQHKKKGHFIIVWTQAGHDWAEAVVEALGLDDFVDMCMDKPKWYYDD